MFDLGGSKGRQQSGHGRSSGLSMGLAPPPPINDFALADGHWAVYGAYQANIFVIRRITKSVVTMQRCFLESK